MSWSLGTKQTWIVSALAHVSLLAIAQFGLPHFFEEPDPSLVVVPVEVVDIGAMTSPPKPAAPEPEPQPRPEAAPPPPPQTPPEPPQAAAEPEPAPVAPPAPKQPEAKPEPPKAEPVPEPEPVPDTRLANAAPVAKPTPPKPAEKPAKKAPPEPSRDFTSVLKDLAADTPKKTPKTAPKPVTPETKAAAAPPQPRISDIATMTEIDALRVSIRRQIEPCWSPPIGAREADELTVKILVFVEPSGRVRRAQIVDPGRMATNPFFEAAADSARRAVLNDRCNPLKDLPPDKYDLWQELELTFNPKDALG